MTTLVTLLVNLSALTDFDLKPVRKRIYNGCAYAMETAGNLVSAAAEFTAGVQDRENNLYCRNARFVVDSNRNASSVIDNRDRVIFVDRYFNVVTEACQCLVHRIIYNLVNQVMQTSGRGGTDIHARPFADRFQTLQNLNLICSVFNAHLYSSILAGIHRPVCYSENFIDLKPVVDKIIQTGTGNNRLNVPDTVQQVILTVAVQLRQHVV